MQYNIIELKQGIKIHFIKTNSFKTNLLAAFLSTPLEKEMVTTNALIPAVLKRGSKKLKTQEEINIALENMYGATFDCGIEKMGDNQILKFYLEGISEKFVEEKIDLLRKNIELMLDIVFNPLIDENGFNTEYVEGEKNTIKHIIESKIDSKDQYTLDKCIETMYSNKGYGLYKYGYVEDLEKIDNKNLYEEYKNLINNSKIDIFLSGDFEEENVIKIIEQNENIKNLKQRQPKYIINNEETEKKEKVEKIKEKTEEMNIAQGKIVIGLDINENTKDSRYIASLYNTILGNSANSKLFQNVREKANLAYFTSSSYIRQKNNIYIKCGIDVKNYEKTIKIIKEQLEGMKNGDFTEKEIEEAKKYMISAIKSIEDEQDTLITYYLGQELSNLNTSLDEYIKNIEKINKKQIQDIANKMEINTIYFLKSY